MHIHKLEVFNSNISLQVRNMMAGGQIGSTRQVRGGEHVELEHPKYRAFAETSVKIISKDREVTLTGPAEEQTIKV